MTATDAAPARRELGTALALAALGAVLVLWSGSQTWSSYRPAQSLLGELPARSSGGELYPGLTAVAWLGLAAAVVLVAVRGWARRSVGVLLVVAGAVVVADGVRALLSMPLPTRLTSGRTSAYVPTSALHAGTGWVLLALLGGALLVLAGVVTAWRGGSWGGLGSSYEPPGAPAEPPSTDKAVWDALDRGDDPTA